MLTMASHLEDLHLEDAANLARRSLSIFSRRGIESPEQPYLNARVYSSPFAITTKDRKKATILNAVPTNKSLRPLKTVQKEQRHKRNKYSDDRIGVWVNGVAHWDEGVSSPRHEVAERPSTSHAKRKPDWNMHKPSLSVVIPQVAGVQPQYVEQKRKQSSARVSPMSSTKSKGSFKKASPSLAGRGSAASQREDPSRSSSNASSCAREDVSVHSNRSSSTSIDGSALRRLKSQHLTNDLTPVTKAYANKPLPPVPGMVTPPTMETISMSFPTPPRSNKSTKKMHPLRQSSTLRKMKSGTRLDEFDQEFMRTSPYNPASEPATPTLSEAEDDLTESLGQLSRHISLLDIHTRAKPQDSRIEGLGLLNITIPTTSQLVDVPEESKRDSIAIVMQPPSRAPTIPKKSRKRDWPAEKEDVPLLPARRLSDSMTPINDAPPSEWWTKHQLNRSASSPTLSKVRSDRDLLPSRFALDDGLVVVSGPTVMRPQSRQAVNPAEAQRSAEKVLVRILESLQSMNDLMNTILINKGMHRVYKENELRLIKTVCQNQSPPAWELREWSPPKKANAAEDEDDFVQYTPSTYLRALRNDTAIINELKKVIVAECSSFIRKDTTASMSDANHPQAQHMNDAFWRIWTFCSVFGSNKGRDEDLTGQLDWLKGGRVANNLDCAATVNVQFDFDGGSILLNAPEYFGQGNGNGLSADELYSITEIWTCMAVLLQGYLGRVEQARQYGVYENCTIEDGDVEMEEYMLEEWIAWILTFGPTAVLEMAQYANDSTATGFHLAQERGWTKWAPPTHTTSRVTFLKEPVTRLYEERVQAANTKAQNAREQEEKEKSRRRIAAHALEIKIRRQDSAFKRVPLIDMSMERPMSILSTLSGGGMLTPRFPPRAMTLPAMPGPTGVHPAHRLNATTLMVPAASAITRGATSHEREALRTLNGVAVDTTEIAIQRIVAMGFTTGQATYALRTTDTGDGLRVDRAVDMLLRSHNDSPEWAQL